MEGFDTALTEEERNAALAEAQDAKDRKTLAYLSDRRRECIEAEIARKWTAKDYWEFFNWKASVTIPPKADGSGGFQVDEHNHQAIKALCMYFAEDPAFEKLEDGYSLNKGLMLCGPVGTGKTTILKLFSANKRRSFQVISCRKVADMYTTHGPEMLHRFSFPHTDVKGINNFYQDLIGTGFDDLGTESTRKHFGDKANVMLDILLNRYDSNQLEPHHTHITTNLNAEEIEENYGTRLRSRTREMFNQIIVGGSDRRK